VVGTHNATSFKFATLESKLVMTAVVVDRIDLLLEATQQELSILQIDLKLPTLW
jgi:hypothetical protein